jgi:hypothetical protein
MDLGLLEEWGDGARREQDVDCHKEEGGGDTNAVVASVGHHKSRVHGDPLREDVHDEGNIHAAAASTTSLGCWVHRGCETWSRSGAYEADEPQAAIHKNLTIGSPMGSSTASTTFRPMGSRHKSWMRNSVRGT